MYTLNTIVILFIETVYFDIVQQIFMNVRFWIIRKIGKYKRNKKGADFHEILHIL